MQTQHRLLVGARYRLSTEWAECWERVLHPAFSVISPLSPFPQNCSIAVCQRIQCDIQSFDSQEEFSVTLKGNLSFDWYIKVSGGRGSAGPDVVLQGPRVQLPPLSPTDFAQPPSGCEHSGDLV